MLSRVTPTFLVLSLLPACAQPTPSLAIVTLTISGPIMDAATNNQMNGSVKINPIGKGE